MESSLALKGNELSGHEMTWRKCKCTSERNQSEKATYRMIPTLGHSRKGETMETAKRSVVDGLESGRDEQVETEDF